MELLTLVTNVSLQLLTVCYVHAHWISFEVDFNVKEFPLQTENR